MDYINDKIIIEELKKGNEDIFKSLFQQYYPILAKYAYRFVYDKNVCEDMVQDVFITLWEKKDVIDIISIKSYLYTAIRNKCLDFLRHCDVRDKNQAFIADTYITFEGEIEMDTELIDKIKTSLATLPGSMKEIFEKKYLLGLSAIDIAEDMGISVNTVNTQLKRAKEKIRLNLYKASLISLIALLVKN